MLDNFSRAIVVYSMNKRLTIDVPGNVHTRFKIVATEKGCTMKELMLDFIKDLILDHEDKKRKENKNTK